MYTSENRKCLHFGRGDLPFLLDFLKKRIVVNNHSNFEKKISTQLLFRGNHLYIWIGSLSGN